MKNYFFNNQIGLESLEKDQQKIRKILDEKVGNYIQHVIHLTPLQIKRFEDACKIWLSRQEYNLPLDYSNLKKQKNDLQFFLQKPKFKKQKKPKKKNKERKS